MDAVNRQHILPAESIKRFYGQGDEVRIIRLSQGRPFPAKASHKLFIAYRKWDEGIERGADKIERAYQKIAGLLCSGLNALDEAQFRVVNDFYAILKERSRARYFEFTGPPRLENLSPPVSRSQKELDDWARDGIFLGGPEQLDQAVLGFAQRSAVALAQRSNPAWSVIRANGAEFLVSDCFHESPLIPVAPTIYLARDRASQVLEKGRVADFNQAVYANAVVHVFARDFDEIGFEIPKGPRAGRVPPARS